MASELPSAILTKRKNIKAKSKIGRAFEVKPAVHFRNFVIYQSTYAPIHPERCVAVHIPEEPTPYRTLLNSERRPIGVMHFRGSKDDLKYELRDSLVNSIMKFVSRFLS